MQKKLIALALAGLGTTAAFAQSNVTIYGRADAGYVSQSGSSGAVTTNGTKTQMASGIGGGSRFGFKGTEDLGNGLKALFQMEFNVNIDSANIAANGSGLGSRNSYVGLTGNFGTAVLGRIDGARYGVATKYDPFGSGYVGAMASLQAHVTRGDNAIAYISPSMSGFTVVAAYTTSLIGQEATQAAAKAATPVVLCAAGDIGAVPGCFAVGDVKTAAVAGTAAKKNNQGDVRLWAIQPTYANGPVSVTLNFEGFKNKDVSNSDGRIAVVAGSYDFGMAKLMGYWERVNTDSAGAAPNTGNGYVRPAGVDAWDQRSWMIGATIPVMGDKAFVRTSYVRLDDKTAMDAAGKQVTGDCNKWGLGFQYNLSKRTNVFTDYARINNKNNGTCTIGFTGTTGSLDASAGAGPAGGVGTKGFDVGLAHVF